uniref:CD99 antigen-like protein 2 n=1 Tax=Cyprinodon variegatus TaxID=28743 RepID=A0A3Q2EBA4_CYPVA
AVVSQGDFDLTDALDDGNKPAPTSRPGKGKGISLEDLLNVGSTSRTTTKAPAKVRPKKPQSSPGGDDFNLADALDENQKPGGGFSDTDLEDVSKDKGYKPDKGKGYGQKDDSSQSSYDGNSEMTAEVGTIAGIISAVSVALVGAISSYISYQKKKLCFSLQQSLDLDLNKAEIPGQVAAEPHGK